MKKALILILTIVLSAPFGAFAGPRDAKADGKLRVLEIGGKFVFELCDQKNTCEPLGRAEGYSRAELERWKEFKEGGFIDNAGLMLPAGAIPLWIGYLILGGPPGWLAIGAGAVILGTFGYFFYRHPQTKTGMPNSVYGEFQSRPEMLESLKKFLREVDEGKPDLRDPRVLSEGKAQKLDGPEERAETAPQPPHESAL